MKIGYRFRLCRPSLVKRFSEKGFQTVGFDIDEEKFRNWSKKFLYPAYR